MLLLRLVAALLRSLFLRRERLDHVIILSEAHLLLLLAAWGQCSDCPEDLNGDGVVDTADLLTLLANWG
jgi:hypothetical protein